MSVSDGRHWSKVQYLHEVVTNPNIHVRGTHSYYSHAWSDDFQDSVVRYLYGDAYSLARWDPAWHIDQLYIGDYVCIAAEAIILMGGNHNHRTDWFSLYPFPDLVVQSYQGKGDTIIGDGAWIGMRAMIMPGVTVGEGAVIATQSVVTRDVAPYSMVAGNPATELRKRFTPTVIDRLLALDIYSWSEEKSTRLRHLICNTDIDTLEAASKRFDQDKRT
ncbi:CatB-related O-acetyltransferase [Nocardia terpenica]|uniref:Chloramphenicol acetyltransferase n=1 Tax=Nocardia terpenica TaxID=455432 RepID=A0A291RY10_9NOCA|nr:CatB-related O-acetyltransferase [Nocardia terpenica]ATL72124.1 antibiotic acetyltransferase [Nocardia terpenica]